MVLDMVHGTWYFGTVPKNSGQLESLLPTEKEYDAFLNLKIIKLALTIML